MKIFGLVSALLFSTSAAAAPQTSLFGGIGTGVGIVHGQEFSSDPQGGQFIAGALVSREWSKWVGDLGVGWIYSKVSGEVGAGIPTWIRTRAALATLGARARLGEHWQLGPELDLAFGTDTRFDPVIGSSSTAWMPGVRGTYQWAIGSIPTRVWAQLSTDTSVSRRQIYWGMVGIQFGFPFSSNKEPHVDLIHTSAAAPAPLRVVLDPSKIFFATNSSRLRPGVDEVLREAGVYLREHPEAWSGAQVGGHADHRGSFRYNRILSERRAKAVVVALGLDEESPHPVPAKGFSYGKPWVSPNATVPSRIEKARTLAMNRRVELVFDGVQEPKQLLKRLEPLMVREKPIVD